MSDYNLVVICPGTNVPLNVAQLTASEQKLNNALSDIKANGQLPENASLKMQFGYLGIASPTFYSHFPLNQIPRIGESKFIVDPQIMGCLSEKQDQAVLLHETGHLHEPMITSLFVVAGYLALSNLHSLITNTYRTLKNIRNDAREVKASEGDALEVPSESSVTSPHTHGLLNGAKFVTKIASLTIQKNWLLLLRPAAGWTAAGLLLISSFRGSEIYADLYAAQNMQTPDYAQSGLTTLDGSILWLVNPKQYKNAPHYTASAQLGNLTNSLIRIVVGGPFGAFVDTHPTIPERNAILEKNRQAIKEKRPLKTSIDLVLNYRL